jgi:hypothetical protein
MEGWGMVALPVAEMALTGILYELDQARYMEMKAKDHQLVHYTSAANAMNIINGQTMWLRNAKLMNDFSEIQFGKWCVHGSIGRLKDLWLGTFAAIHADLPAMIANQFDGLENHRITHTYILSLSEHPKEEDDLGRLSMWRAYGGGGGIAMVFDNSVMDQDPTDLNITSSIVHYMDQDQFAARLQTVLHKIAEQTDLMKSFDPAVLADRIATFLHYAVLSTKHPAFAEEKEIRMLTGVNRSEIAEMAVEVVNGTPQVVWKLPLKDDPEREYWADLKRILKRIIIGPVVEPPIVNEALRIALAGKGFENAEQIVHTSWVPLRTSL